MRVKLTFYQSPKKSGQLLAAITTTQINRTSFATRPLKDTGARIFHLNSLSFNSLQLYWWNWSSEMVCLRDFYSNLFFPFSRKIAITKLRLRLCFFQTEMVSVIPLCNVWSFILFFCTKCRHWLIECSYRPALFCCVNTPCQTARWPSYVILSLYSVLLSFKCFLWLTDDP